MAVVGRAGVVGRRRLRGRRGLAASEGRLRLGRRRHAPDRRHHRQLLLRPSTATSGRPLPAEQHPRGQGAGSALQSEGQAVRKGVEASPSGGKGIRFEYPGRGRARSYKRNEYLEETSLENIGGILE